TACSKTNDVIATSKQVEVELENLTSRTGAAALCFIVRGNPDHPMKPLMFATKGLMDFVQMILGFDIGDFLSRLEGFSTCGIKGTVIPCLHVLSICIYNLQYLEQITSQNDIWMKWGSGYWTKIVWPHRVIIWSWPPQITFTCLTKSCSSLSDLHVLLKAWTENTTYWAKLTDSEFVEEERKRSNQICARFLLADKPHKTRSDKGKKRVQTQNMRQSIVSAPTIDTGDEEDGANGGDDNDNDTDEDIHTTK
ncbi:hypothetical protein BJV78DRAFT_1139975, partial [Lactifluus subvellereus]